MQRDIWPLLTHPDVPLAPLANSGMLDESIRRNASPKGENEPAVEDVPTAPGFPGSTGGYSGSGMQGSMPGGYSGSSEGYGSSGMGGSRGPIMAGGMGGMAGSGGSGGSYGSGYGGGYGSGYGSGYGGEGMSGMNLVPPKYKLVRFTDTHVELGKHYRYRVAVQLNDPNHPHINYLPPTLASLDGEVQKRIKAQDAEDAKNAKPNFRTFWRVSPFSEPSEVVSLPSPNRFFAGSVEQPGSQELIPGKPKVANGQPAVKVLTSAWDPVKVADIPVEESAYRGSILNFVKEAKVIHPVNHDVVEFKDYKFQTNAIVADLMGGESIPKRDKKSSDPLKAPGELLVVDAEGNLHVQNETDDIEDFRRLLVPEPKTPTTPAGAAGEGYPTGDPAESGGYNNYPGASGGRRPRSSARGNSGS